MRSGLEQPSEAAFYRAFYFNCSWGDDPPNVNIRTISLEYAHSQRERPRPLLVHGTAEMKHLDFCPWY